MLILAIITVLLSLLIALAIIFKGYRRISNMVFSVGLLATAFVTFGDAMSMFKPEQLTLWKKVVFISESIMAPSWLLFTISFARSDYREVIGKFLKLLLLLSPAPLVLLLVMPQTAFFYSPEFESEKVLFLGNAGYIFNILLLLYSIASILNLEATLKSSSGMKRWQIKYPLLGVGGILAVNIFYYSHAFLYRSIDMNLLPVRTGVFLISILLIVFSLLRHKFMDVEVTVSRGIFYRSLGIIIVGFYLLGLGLIGEGMRYFGPSVGKNITIFIGFAGAIGILVVILSEEIRKKVMVFINKNFYSQKYDYRSQWMQFTQLISSKHSFDELLNSIAEGFKEAMGVKGATIWLKEKGNGEYFCAKTLDAPHVEIKPNEELIEFLKDKKWIFNVNDDHCKHVAALSIEFIKKSTVFLIVPLLDTNKLIGFVVLREGLANNNYNYEDYDLLKVLARQATAAIMNMRLTEELMEAKELEAMGKLSSFIIHDLKNTTSMLSLIAQNAEEHIVNPDFQMDAIKSITNSAEKINGLIQKLKNLPSKISLNLEHADLGLNVRKALKEFKINGKIKLFYEEIEQVKTRFDREEIRKVILNLVINAFEASSIGGEIKVTVGIENGMGFVRISDKGPGMSKEFIETNLFKPFQTTKKKGLGIGLYQCKSIVEAHSGKLKVRSEKGKGTDFSVYLPLTPN